MVVSLPAVAMTVLWAVLTAVVYWLLMKWSGPAVAWTIVPGVARGVRDWIAGEPPGRADRGAASPSSVEARSTTASRPELGTEDISDPVAEVVDL